MVSWNSFQCNDGRNELKSNVHLPKNIKPQKARKNVFIFVFYVFLRLNLLNHWITISDTITQQYRWTINTASTVRRRQYDSVLSISSATYRMDERKTFKWMINQQRHFLYLILPIHLFTQYFNFDLSRYIFSFSSIPFFEISNFQLHFHVYHV